MSRLTMADVVSHPWMQGKQATPEEFANSCRTMLAEAKAARAKQAEGVDFNISTAGRRRRGQGEKRAADQCFAPTFGESHTFAPCPKVSFGRTTASFALNGLPLGIMMELYDIISETITTDIKISGNTWKLTFEGTYEDVEDENE